MQSSHKSKEASKKWRKVLYIKQDVPDNYVDETFLTNMKKNLYLRSYNYLTLVRNSSRITQQINTVLIFVMCYVFLSENLLSTYVLNTISLSTMIGSYLLTRKSEYVIDVKAVTMFCIASFALSPVLMSLTETISTDTIYAMTTVMFVLHLFSHDYQDEATEISGVVSFNAVIFATVCLASRLEAIPSAIALILLSILLFTVLPITRRYIRTSLPTLVDIFVTILMYVLSAMMILSQNLALSVFHFLITLGLSFLCPFLLLKLQPLKNNIYGPWDEAVVKL